MNWQTNRINPNQTPESRGTGNRRSMPRRSNAVPQNRQGVSSRPAASKANGAGKMNTLSNYGVTRPASSLSEGQVIKGEITDLRNHAVVVTLDDNTTVTAQIEDNGQLAIGETAAFRVSSITNQGIILIPLPKRDVALQMSTIQKALEAADLPKNDRNIELVHSLMKNQMPINKDTILKMLQLTGQHKDASIDTIIFMNKHHLPITIESTAQFERYKNNEHHFILEVNRLCDSLPTLLEKLSHSEAHPDFPEIGSRILTILLEPDASENAENILQKTSIPAAETSNISSISRQPAIFSSPEAASELLDILENATLSEELPAGLKESLLSGTISLDDVIYVLEKAMYRSLTIDNQNLQELGIPCKIDITPSGEIKYIQLPTDASNQSLALSEKEPSLETSGNTKLQNFFSFFNVKSENKNAQSQTALVSSNALLETTDKELFFQTIATSSDGKSSQPLLCLDIFNSDVVHDLWNQYTALQQENHSLGTLLSMNQRYEFSNLLKEFPFNETAKENIISGKIDTNTLLHLLKNVLPFSDEEQVGQLFTSKTFQDILKNEWLQNFTLTPNDLKNKFKMNRHFDRIYEQLEELETEVHRSITSKNTDAAAQLTNQAPGQNEEQLLHQMKSNLDFMKTLNEMFSYLQLPLQLKNQTAHGELYVYTKKNSLKEHPKSIRVLLHLDLEHLKSIDMHITLEQNKVDSKFYFLDETAEKLVKTNLPLLESALAEKGYISHTEVLKMEKTQNAITNFIEEGNGIPSTSMKRFSFDIRA